MGGNIFDLLNGSPNDDPLSQSVLSGGAGMPDSEAMMEGGGPSAMGPPPQPMISPDVQPSQVAPQPQAGGKREFVRNLLGNFLYSLGEGMKAAGNAPVGSEGQAGFGAALQTGLDIPERKRREAQQQQLLEARQNELNMRAQAEHVRSQAELLRAHASATTAEERAKATQATIEHLARQGLYVVVGGRVLDVRTGKPVPGFQPERKSTLKITTEGVPVNYSDGQLYALNDIGFKNPLEGVKLREEREPPQGSEFERAFQRTHGRLPTDAELEAYGVKLRSVAPGISQGGAEAREAMKLGDPNEVAELVHDNPAIMAETGSQKVAVMLAMRRKGFAVPAESKITTEERNREANARTVLQHSSQLRRLVTENAGLVGPWAGRVGLAEQTIGGKLVPQFTASGDESPKEQEMRTRMNYLLAAEAKALMGGRPAYRWVQDFKKASANPRMTAAFINGALNGAEAHAENVIRTMDDTRYGDSKGTKPGLYGPIQPRKLSDKKGGGIVKVHKNIRTGEYETVQ